MKRILSVFGILLFVSTMAVAQDTTKTEFTPYVATGLSMTNSNDFKASSYPSAEVGVMFENLSVAAVFGRNNLVNDSTVTGLDNYWYEAKVAFSFPLGSVSGYGIFGVGTYIGTPSSLFIEYGGGIAKEFGSIGTFLQVSSWDGITYVTPGLSYSF